MQVTGSSTAAGKLGFWFMPAGIQKPLPIMTGGLPSGPFMILDEVDANGVQHDYPMKGMRGVYQRTEIMDSISNHPHYPPIG